MILSRVHDEQSQYPHSGYVEISQFLAAVFGLSPWPLPPGDPVTPSTGHTTLKTAESASPLRYKITLIFSACSEV